MDEKENITLEAEKPVKKATTTKKKTTRSKAKKEVKKVAEKAAKEAVEISEIATTARKSIITEKPNDDRVTCMVCGRTAPRKTCTKVGEDGYVCSARCLSRYGQTHREHSHI